MNIPVTLNVKSANAIPVISCMQGDTPTIVCTVMNDTEKFIVDKAEFDLCVCEGETAKHKAVTINASTNGNTVSVKMTKNETDEAGDIKLCIRFSNTKNNTVISTFPFILKATQNPSYSAVGQMDDVSALTDYVAEAKKYADNAKETTADVSTLAQKTTEKAQEAESSATAAKESANIADNRATEAQEAAAATSKSSSTATSAAEYAASCQKEIEQLASEVENNSNIAKSYAVGETSARDNEDIDNAKYYSEQAKNYADKAQQATKQIEVDSELSETSTNPVENKVINAEIDNLQLQINDIGQNDTLAHNSIHTSIDKVSQEENITRGILTQWQEQGRIPNGIVNNLVTTEEGYVADARQLNESIKGSFAEKIINKLSYISSRIKSSTIYEKSTKTISSTEEVAYAFNNPGIYYFNCHCIAYGTSSACLLLVSGSGSVEEAGIIILGKIEKTITFAVESSFLANGTQVVYVPRLKLNIPSGARGEYTKSLYQII
jgi:hypothetical protein